VPALQLIYNCSLLRPSELLSRIKRWQPPQLRSLLENIKPPRDKDGGAIWQQLEENNCWVALMNFEKHNILSIYKVIQPSLPS